MFLKNNYTPVLKNHCPGTLSCSSKIRNSKKMSTSTNKIEYLFSTTPPSDYSFVDILALLNFLKHYRLNDFLHFTITIKY